MTVDVSYLALNSSTCVTPLNLNGWLREQLRAQTWDEEDEIMVFLFVTETCIGTLGRKKFEKLVRKAAGKHSWIDEIEVLPVKAPIQDDEAKARTSAVMSERLGSTLDGLETTFLGYASDSDAERFLRSHDVEPVCLVRQTTARDIQHADVEHATIQLNAWMVISIDESTDTELVISPPIETFGEAMAYAKETYGAVRFLTIPIGF